MAHSYPGTARDGPCIYRLSSQQPTVCYIPGYESTCLNSNKCKAVYEATVECGVGFLAWDHTPQQSVEQWWKDSRDWINTHAPGPAPVILVTASMGLWLALLVVTRSTVGQRVQTIISMGGSVDFTQSWLKQVPGDHRNSSSYVWKRPSVYSPSGYYSVPVSTLIESQGCIMMDKPLARKMSLPVVLLHGEEDVDVSLRVAEGIQAYLQENNTQKVALVKIVGGDHRLSDPKTLLMLRQSLLDSIHKASFYSQ